MESHDTSPAPANPSQLRALLSQLRFLADSLDAQATDADTVAAVREPIHNRTATAARIVAAVHARRPFSKLTTVTDWRWPKDDPNPRSAAANREKWALSWTLLGAAFRFDHDTFALPDFKTISDADGILIQHGTAHEDQSLGRWRQRARDHARMMRVIADLIGATGDNREAEQIDKPVTVTQASECIGVSIGHVYRQRAEGLLTLTERGIEEYRRTHSKPANKRDQKSAKAKARKNNAVFLKNL